MGDKKVDLFDQKSWPGKMNLVGYDDVDLGCDCYLLGVDQLEQLYEFWCELEKTDEIPDVLLNRRWAALQKRTEVSTEVDVCITMATRWHGALKILPKDKFVVGVDLWNFDKRTYIVVDQEWFDQIESQSFSLYGLIDVVGMRGMLDRLGQIPEGGMTKVKSEIDELAGKHDDHAFITFADNVLLKANCSTKGDKYKESYRPEEFVALCDEVRAVFRDSWGLDAYAIVTQGFNFFDDRELLAVSELGNHIFIGGLSSPFAELFDIERGARKSIREERHKPCELYLSESVFLTLKFKELHGREPFLARAQKFNTTLPVHLDRYIPTQAEELLKALR